MKKIITGFFILLHFACFSSKAQQFIPIDTLPLGAYGAAAWGDFDNDNQMDLAYITQALPDDIFKVYHNVSNQFVEVAQHFPALYNPAVKWADFNNDGFDDLIACGMDSVFNTVVKIFESNGSGTFTEINNSFFGLSAGSIGVTDYNNDGKLDFAYTGFDSVGGHHAFIYKNNGNFNFTNINATLIGTHFGEMQWGDYNNDSLPDLIINGIGDTDFRCRVYKNLGTDNFQLQPFFIKGSGGTVDWFDYNNDGWKDILVTGYDSTSGTSFTELHENNQNGTFTVTPTNLPEFGEPSSVAIADFNNDANEDVCLLGGNAGFVSSILAMGSGTTTYSLSNFFQVDILNSVAEAVDIDNDGDVDLLLNNLILRNDLPLGNSISNIQERGFNLFPVPATDYITIELTNDNSRCNISIVSVEGKIMKQLSAKHSAITLCVSDFPDGIYFAEIKTDIDVTVNKFVKE